MQETNRIAEYYEQKYGLGTLGLLKSIVVSSMFIKNKDVIPLSVLIIAPSGQFKSRSTKELEHIFSNKTIIDLGSDFTIHSMINRFKEGRLCNNKTICINDLTLLFSSKSPRTKERLVNALAEVLSEGVYQYGERLEPNLRFEARINIIANITQQSYNHNKKDLIDNTFIERLVPVFYNVSDEKQLEFVKDMTNKKAMRFDKRIKLKSMIIANYQDYNDKIINLAQRYKAYTLSPSLPRCADKIKAMIGGICIINGRDKIIDEDILLVESFMPYFSAYNSKDIQIVALYQQGISHKDIVSRLGYESTYPYKVIQKYRDRGLLS